MESSHLDPQIQKCPGVSPHSLESLVGLRQSIQECPTPGHPPSLSLEGSQLPLGDFPKSLVLLLVEPLQFSSGDITKEPRKCKYVFGLTDKCSEETQ